MQTKFFIVWTVTIILVYNIIHLQYTSINYVYYLLSNVASKLKQIQRRNHCLHQDAFVWSDFVVFSMGWLLSSSHLSQKATIPPTDTGDSHRHRLLIIVAIVVVVVVDNDAIIEWWTVCAYCRVTWFFFHYDTCKHIQTLHHRTYSAVNSEECSTLPSSSTTTMPWMVVYQHG